ncbi:hypothetical protein RKD32_000077 [Streptomyces sp. SAI-195]
MNSMHIPAVNESDLPLAMEQNLAEHACHLQIRGIMLAEQA